MNKREAQRQILRARCLEVVRSRKLSTVADVAKALGLPFSPVGHMLRKLQVEGVIEAEIVTFKTQSRGGGEQRRVYRVSGTITVKLPSWLDPTLERPEGTPKTVKGRAGFLRRM